MPKAPSKYLTPRYKEFGKSENFRPKNNTFRANNNMNHLGGNPRMGFDSRSPLKPQTLKRSIECSPGIIPERGIHKSSIVREHLQYMFLNSSPEKLSPLQIPNKRTGEFSILKSKDPTQNPEPCKIFGGSELSATTYYFPHLTPRGNYSDTVRDLTKFFEGREISNLINSKNLRYAMGTMKNFVSENSIYSESMNKLLGLFENCIF
jgi:hypothetical protein